MTSAWQGRGEVYLHVQVLCEQLGAAKILTRSVFLLLETNENHLCPGNKFLGAREVLVQQLLAPYNACEQWKYCHL